jgi:hypothetical protein
MAIQPRPDIVGALIAHLLLEEDLTAVVSTRISARFKKADWTNPTTGKPRSSILLRAQGGLQGKRHLNTMKTRVTALCYGSNGHEAERTWAIFDAVFCPGQERPGSFHQIVNGAKCLVYDVQPESPALVGVEPTTEYPRAVCSYIVTWLGIPL